jgi:hypothetical protein
MNTIRRLALVFCMTLFNPIVGANQTQDFDGRHLLRECSITVKALEDSPGPYLPANGKYCYALVLGFFMGTQVQHGFYSTSLDKQHGYCLPSDFRVYDAIKHIVNYLNDNPSHQKHPINALFLMALMPKYDCKLNL